MIYVQHFGQSLFSRDTFWNVNIFKYIYGSIFLTSLPTQKPTRWPYRLLWRPTSEQIRSGVGPTVGPDQLPVKVVLLSLAVVTQAGVQVLVEGAAAWTNTHAHRHTHTGDRKKWGPWVENHTSQVKRKSPTQKPFPKVKITLYSLCLLQLVTFSMGTLRK